MKWTSAFTVTTFNLYEYSNKEPNMADIVPEIEARRARRGYTDKAVPTETILRVFEAATKAPSCNNKQPWRFLIADEGEALAKAREALASGNYWAKVAPVLVVVTTQDDLDCRLSDNRDYAMFDTGMAVMGLMMQATREGLYAHPMAGFSPETLRESFGIEDETRVVTMIAIGYPGDGTNLNEKHAESEKSDRTRKELAEVVQWNGWQPI
jgi:nitroreductase